MRSARFIGVFFVLISALVFSSAGLFVKGVSADSWSILFWRGIFATLFTVTYIVLKGTFRKEFYGMGKAGVAAGLVGASATIAFIPSFKFTSIANVSLIYAASPFVATAIAWVWFREKPSGLVLGASLAAFAGVLLIVSGSLGDLSLRGDLLALWMTLGMAIYLCIYRRFPQTPSAGPGVLLSLILVPIGWLLGDPISAPLKEILIMGCFGLVFAVASITLAEGARRLPASETALLSALETPLAPVWAYLIFTEVPGLLTVAGGIIILMAVYTSQALQRVSNR